jgi:hypothetical protein
VGKGLRITGSGATDGWQDVSDYCNAYASRAWGQFQERSGIYYVYGHLYVGDSAQAAVTTLTDGGRVFKFGDFSYYTGSAWATAIPNGHNGLTVEDSAGFATTFEDGSIVGSDKGSGGSVFLGSDDTNTTFDLYGGSNAGSTTKLYGTIINGVDGGLAWGNDSDHHCYSVTFDGCGQFDPVGGVKIRNCIFSGYTSDTDAALLWNSNMDIEDCVFAGNTDGTNDPHAIEHPASGSYDYTNLLFSDNDFDVNFSAASGALTINKVGTSDPTTYEITGGGSTVHFYRLIP